MTSAGVARRMPRSGIVGSWFGADRPPTETALAFPVCFTHLRNTGVKAALRFTSRHLGFIGSGLRRNTCCKSEDLSLWAVNQ